MRMACAVGAVAVGLIGSGEAFADVPLADLTGHVRSVVAEILSD
jgi:hypothetical protein